MLLSRITPSGVAVGGRRCQVCLLHQHSTEIPLRPQIPLRRLPIPPRRRALDENQTLYQLVAQNRISRFTYTAGDPTATRDSELVLVTTGVKYNGIHSAGWLGFKPSAYGEGVSETSSIERK